MSKNQTTGFYRARDPGLGALDFEGEVSLTHQSFKDDCDINKLMARYEKTGILDHVNRVQGAYGDFSETVDFQTAFDVVRNAEAMFMTLPARVRADFRNDPGEFLTFATNPENQEKMIEYGLATRRTPEPTPSKPGEGGAPAGSQSPPAGDPPKT